MAKKVMLLALALAMIATLAAPLSAADTRKSDFLVRSNNLIGVSVRNPAGDYLGKIEDVVIDMRNGQVVYLAMGHGETLGFGGKMFAVAPDAFGYGDLDRKMLSLDEKKDQLDRMAGFDANRWPTHAAATWGKNRNAKNAVAKEDDEARKHFRRVSTLIGCKVRNQRNEDLGRIYDLPFDPTNFHIAYAAVAHGGVARIGEKLFAVSWDALHYDAPDLKAGDRAFLLHVSVDDFKNATGFDTKNWPTKPDDRFRPVKTGKDKETR